MKNIKRIGALTAIGSMISVPAFAAGGILADRLVDWISIVAEILSFVCLAAFIVYTGKYLSTSKNVSESGENVKVSGGIKNGIMTALVGIAICQAAIIVAQAVFAKMM